MIKPVIAEKPSKETELYDKEWKDFVALYFDNGFLNEEIYTFITLQMDLKSYNDGKVVYSFIKRILDLSCATLLLIITLPILIIISILIKLTSPGPIIFRQERMGRYYQPFTIYKFRTMNEGSKRTVPFMSRTPHLRPLNKENMNEHKVTKIGAFLRETGLDELPQLINVLMGNMSMIGPRPLPLDDTATTPKEYYYRLAAKPGISGLWQATFRYTRDGMLKLSLDCEYVKKRTILFDTYLILKTVKVVCAGFARKAKKKDGMTASK